MLPAEAPAAERVSLPIETTNRIQYRGAQTTADIRRLFSVPSEELDVPPLGSPLYGIYQDQAVGMEIMDERERRYVLTNPRDFRSDIRLLGLREENLKDAPPLADSFFLPDSAVIAERIAFNRAHLQFLIDRIGVDLAKEDLLREAIKETQTLYCVLDAMRDARCKYYYVTYRRYGLKNLRDRIGVENYYNKKFPPPAPVWRFTWID